MLLSILWSGSVWGLAAIPIASRSDAIPIQHVSLVFMNVSRCAGILSKVGQLLDWIRSPPLFPCPRLVPDLHSAPVANLLDQELSMNRRVWILFVALRLSTIFAVRRAFSQSQSQ